MKEGNTLLTKGDANNTQDNPITKPRSIFAYKNYRNMYGEPNGF